MRVTLAGSAVQLPGVGPDSARYNLALGFLQAYVQERLDDLVIRREDFPISLDEPRFARGAAERLLAGDPALIGISSYCWDLSAFEEVVHEIKRRSPATTVVVGGPSATYAGEELLARCPVDVAVVGEGEETFLELLRSGARDLDRVAGLLYRDGDAVRSTPPRPGVDLTTVPSPYLAGVLRPPKSNLMLECSRGCAFRCRYCAWKAFLGGLRHTPVDSLRRELGWAREHGYEHAFILDSAVNFDTDRLVELGAALRGAGGLRFSYFVSHTHLDEAQAEALAGVPSHEIYVGLESVNPPALRTVGRRRLDREAFETAVARLGRVGPVVVSIILGIPGDTLAGFRETVGYCVDLADRVGVSAVRVFWMIVPPGTSLWTNRERHGIRTASPGVPYLVDSASFPAADLAEAFRFLLTHPRRSLFVYDDASPVGRLPGLGDLPAPTRTEHRRPKRAGAGDGGRLDALFLHAPRVRGDRREVMVLPLGVPALANLLDDEGRSVEILHLGIEPEVDRRFSLRRELARHRPRLVLVPLHFNPQTRDAIDTARRARAWAPDAKIVMGGLTASVFASDLCALGIADAVVSGDGEEPLRALARVLLDGEGRLSDVPNLTYVEDERVHESARRFVLDPETAGRLRHGSLARLRHRDAYLGRALYADFSEGAEGSAGYPQAAYLNAGRGCTAGCLHCGGSREAQQLTSAREGLLLYPLDKLVRDVREATGEGARVLRTCFDPPAARPHIERWLDAIRSDGARLRTVYDLWAPAPRRFLEVVSRSFEPGSMVVLSPDAGSEDVRRRVRGFSFSNEQLLRSIADAEDLGLGVHCFFSAGLAGETPADVDETARLIERIRAETRAGVSVTPMYLDPASAVFVDPDRFGLRLTRRTLRELYEEPGVPDGPGYETACFSEQEILDACARLRRVAGLSG